MVNYMSGFKKLFFKFSWIIAFALLLSIHSYGDEDERIIHYDSQIIVNPDASMNVTETIKVHSEGDQIKHGIYRDFPIRYRSPLGYRYNVDFHLLEVLKNGNQEPYHTEGMSNGIRIYIGNKDILLSSGDYTYTIKYSTARQMGFFKDHDELYWNVTGNGWVFSIEQASATVIFPPGVSSTLLSMNGSTGPEGATDKNFQVYKDTAGNVVYQTTQTLSSHEGLTIVVTFPKGFFKEPTPKEKAQLFLRDNISVVIGSLGMAILFLYYIIVWALVRGPAKGTIIPLYGPPNRFSPADVRFVSKMSFDKKAFTANILDMAVKGFLTIKEEKGIYTLTRTKKEDVILDPDERKIADSLLGSKSSIQLIPVNHSEISSAIGALKSYLKLNYEKNYFLNNTQYFIPGVVLSIILLFVTGFWGAQSAGNIPVFIFMTIWLSGWSVGVVFLVCQMFTLWKDAIFGTGHHIASTGGALFMTLFSIPFVGGEVMGLYFLSTTSSVFVIVVLLVLAIVNVIFYHLLKAPTLVGRKILDQIEGFKMYLSVAEKDRLNAITPVNKTPELFEKFLPFALALDVEQKWAEQFADVLSKSSIGGKQYSPSWYQGTSWSTLGAMGFASSMSSSFSNAISSSSTAPGSSSGEGGGGGGFSGGGGGGGGGGGW